MADLVCNDAQVVVHVVVAAAAAATCEFKRETQTSALK